MATFKSSKLNQPSPSFTASSASICPRPRLLLFPPRASLYPASAFLYPASASLYSHLCFHLSSPRSRSASRHPRFTSRRSFSHDFSLQRHTLFGIKLCIASSFPVICLCFVPRHTFYRTKVCIANKVIWLPPISISRYRFFLPKECVADRKHIP